jgi:hypothetical protein
MIVRQSSTPENKCPNASHQPQSTTHMTLPIVDATPASVRLTTVLPNGQRANAAGNGRRRDWRACRLWS